MKALIIRGKDRHTIRLIQGLEACGIRSYVVSTSDVPTAQFDIAFIDPSYEFDVKINASKFFFFDCEDGADDFFEGSAYELFKTKVLAYAKFSYRPSIRNDTIPNIALPLKEYLNVSRFASIPITSPSLIPTFYGHPTFLGGYAPKENINYLNTNTIRSLAKIDNQYMYNQRIDWLLTLKNKGLPFIGGLIFHPDNANTNLTIKWQEKYFGNVTQLQASPKDFDSMMHLMIGTGLSLCPAGHERSTYRISEAMATGSIVVLTDMKKTKMLFNPKDYITIEDGQDIATELEKYNLKELHNLSRKNREQFTGLNPFKLYQIFLKQLELI